MEEERAKSKTEGERDQKRAREVVNSKKRERSRDKDFQEKVRERAEE